MPSQCDKNIKERKNGSFIFIIKSDKADKVFVYKKFFKSTKKEKMSYEIDLLLNFPPEEVFVLLAKTTLLDETILAIFELGIVIFCLYLIREGKKTKEEKKEETEKVTEVIATKKKRQ